MSNPRVSVIEITFEDGSSDTIQLLSSGCEGVEFYDWTCRHGGRKKNSGAYTAVAIATYLYATAITGECINFAWLTRMTVALGEAYARCR